MTAISSAINIAMVQVFIDHSAPATVAAAAAMTNAR
jgi:hypothetical protein